MEMTRFEKFFVNRELKGRRNVARVRAAISDPNAIRDVLEIGCGIGTASAQLANEFGWNAIGTDYDVRQIEEAKRRYPKRGGLRFQCEDATRLSFADASFDFAFAQNTFHHIREWPKAVRELARVLRPGGILFWSDFVVPERFHRVFGAMIDWTGVCVREELRREFSAAGFVLVREHRATPTAITFDELIYQLIGDCRP